MFVKYSLRDWKPLIDEMRVNSPGYQALAEAIELLLTKPQRRVVKRKAKTAAKAKQPRLPLVSGARAELLDPLLRALNERRLAPAANDLRAIYINVGLKDKFPATRSVAIELLIKHMDKLPEEAFRSAIADIGRYKREGEDSLGDEYQRWFEMIFKAQPNESVSRTTKGTKPI